MISIRDALIFLNQLFFDHQIEIPDRHAEDLLGYVLNLSRQEMYLNRDHPLTLTQWETCQEWARQRLQGVPLQYLHGEVEFYDCKIAVNRHVLIPRQETEILVDKMVHELKKENLADKVLWDLCCGSGCIAIALKKKFPQLNVIASDLSVEALKITSQNAKNNQVDISIVQGDFLQALNQQKVHYLVCNPPYIPFTEYINLSKEVLEYEPSEALLAGETGLEFYESLSKDLPVFLYSASKIWLEIGYNQGEALLNLFQDSKWIDKKVEKDWAGHDRFFSCQYIYKP